jgi:lipoprotein-anchoring transpeptidase ErfK/SrfK
MADGSEQGWQQVKQKLRSLYPNLESMDGAVVSISQQRLYLTESGNNVAEYVISSSRYGQGSESGSLKTPLGIHRVEKKYGAEAPSGTIFKSRINTGEIAEVVAEPLRTDDDFVTTRILWLQGQEPGLNRGESIDSFKRYIYIHGTHEEGLLGQPASKGCIRMFNEDVITVFDQLPEQALVVIIP